MSAEKTIYLAYPRGFCAGVRRALDTVHAALKKYGTPIYVLHEIVHNEFVVNALRDEGVVFVEDLKDIPKGNRPVVFSAHGVSREKEEEASSLGLHKIDATCPLVKRIHRKAHALQEDGSHLIIIGHPDHPEIQGTLGQIDGDAWVVQVPDDVDHLPDFSGRIAFLTQTTLSANDVEAITERLREQYPQLEGHSDVCYATQNRQDAVKDLAKKCDVIFVIGSAKSSNSNRLCEVAKQCGVAAFLIASAEDLTTDMLEEHTNVGISAGASAPEGLVKGTVDKLKANGWEKIVESTSNQETITFPLPEL